MTIIRILALGLALGAAAMAAQAQSSTGASRDDRLVVVARPDEGLGRRSVLARELLELSTGPNFAKEFERAMVEQMGKLDEKGEEAVWVRTNMPPMLTRMATRLMDDLAPIYATVFTEEEIRAQIDFYRSPIGRSVASKTVSLGVASQEAETTAMTSLLEEFEAKYCAQFDCGDEGQTAAKSTR
jgi:uncharacterized protein